MGNTGDPQNDPFWQAAQQHDRQAFGNIIRQHEALAKKEQYYQRQLAKAVTDIPFEIGKQLYKYIRCVFFVYVAPFFGVGIARNCIAGALYLQQGKGFFNLGLALGLIDVILFVLGAVFAIATLAAIAWGFWSMTWVGKILAMFFGYSVGVWWIHHWESDFGWKAAGAWFFCIVLSSIIEGLNLKWQRRMAGPTI